MVPALQSPYSWITDEWHGHVKFAIQNHWIVNQTHLKIQWKDCSKGNLNKDGLNYVEISRDIIYKRRRRGRNCPWEGFLIVQQTFSFFLSPFSSNEMLGWGFNPICDFIFPFLPVLREFAGSVNIQHFCIDFDEFFSVLFRIKNSALKGR